ncbi:hypothetical protein FOA52_007413 [Chlamydomonas sp. UWO 241]|nr:hypothetical protein FOA52_007413 [Chlamydomonas sp. UWO 241]
MSEPPHERHSQSRHASASTQSFFSRVSHCGSERTSQRDGGLSFGVDHDTREHQEQALFVRLRSDLGSGVDEALKRAGEEGLTDLTLRRFLVARKWKYDDARAALKAHAHWRTEYFSDGPKTEGDPNVALHVKNKTCYVQGFPADGHLVLAAIVKNHIPQTPESCKDFICYALDVFESIGRMRAGWDGKGVGIIYLTGLGMKNADIHSGKCLFETLQAHYPERLHRLYLYDAPLIFYGLWKMVSPFVDPETQKKIVFVYPKKESHTAMMKELGREVLPPEMGGTGRWVPVEHARAALLKGDLSLANGFVVPAAVSGQGQQGSTAGQGQGAVPAGNGAAAAGNGAVSGHAQGAVPGKGAPAEQGQQRAVSGPAAVVCAAGTGGP